jgi:hypothetical protein
MNKKTNKVINFIKRNDTNIITGAGIADGLILGSYLWYKTGQKILKIIQVKEKEYGRKLTKKEFIKETWKMFILPAFNTLLSGALLIFSTKIGNKRLAALGAAYNLTEVAFQQYIDKTKELVGEKKSNDIKESVCKESIANAEKKDSVVMLASGNNDVWVHEPYTDTYFMSNWNKVQTAVIDLNLDAMNSLNGRVSMSDWLYHLGISKTSVNGNDCSIDVWENMGWDIQRHGKNGKIDVEPIAVLNSNNEPCVEIYYNTRPEYFTKY